MNVRILLIFNILSILCFISCKEEARKSIKKIVPSFRQDSEAFIVRNGDTVQKVWIEVADTPYKRQTGLMYRKQMDLNQGMLFVFDEERPQSFYMKNTYIPLDIIYIGKNHTVVSIQKDAKPLDEKSLPSEGPAQYVLEINSGLSDQWELKKGDTINWQDQ